MSRVLDLLISDEKYVKSSVSKISKLMRTNISIGIF